MIKFSVILPVYNCSRFVEDAIDSVLNQDYTNFELIVVNDGSTDNTLDIITKYKDNIIIHNQSKSGVSVARNIGSGLATGNYLAFIDSDDLWVSHKLSCQRNKITDGYEFCYTNRYNIGDIGDLPVINTDICVMPEGNIYLDLLFSNMITTSSVVINKKIFTDLGGFDEKLTHCEDWDLWIRYSKSNSIGVCLEPLVRYRHHCGGLSSNYLSMARSREIVIRNAIDSVNEKILSLKVKRKIYSKCYASSGWESAKSKDYINAFKFYKRALFLDITSFKLWYDFMRFITGRI